MKYTCDDVDIIENKLVYDGFFKVREYKLKHRLFAGSWSPELSRELFVRGHAVGVLLYDPLRDKVALLEQFRVGAINHASPWLFEVVAGMMKPGEEASAVALRETLEETGCNIEKLIPICDYYTSPGGTSEILHLFCARVDCTLVSGVHGLPEEGEDILLHVVDRETAYQWVVDGTINNSPAIIALQWLQLNLAKAKEMLLVVST